MSEMQYKTEIDEISPGSWVARLYGHCMMSIQYCSSKKEAEDACERMLKETKAIDRADYYNERAL